MIPVVPFAGKPFPIMETYSSKADLQILSEEVDSPVPGLTHRYPDRVLFLITDQCSMYCRHCTRRRFAGQRDAGVSWDLIEQGIEYIRRTPEVRDVLLSGGDALLMADQKLEEIIKRLRGDSPCGDYPHWHPYTCGHVPRGSLTIS